jgi:hypothetical protein
LYDSILSDSTIYTFQARTKGLHKYTPNSHVRLVSIGPKRASPFVNATIDKVPDEKGYYDISIVKNDGYHGIVNQKSEFLCKFVMLDELSRDDERRLTGAVHGVRMLHKSAETVLNAYIGKETFQYYPPTEIELSTFCQPRTRVHRLIEGKYRIINMIDKCNRRTILRNMINLGTISDDSDNIEDLIIPLQIHQCDRLGSMTENWFQKHGKDMDTALLENNIDDDDSDDNTTKLCSRPVERTSPVTYHP